MNMDEKNTLPPQVQFTFTHKDRSGGFITCVYRHDLCKLLQAYMFDNLQIPNMQIPLMG
jgi:hypothetical protein